MNQFLSAIELRGMRQDFEVLLGSPEATTIWFEYQSGGTIPLVDPVFGVTDYVEEPTVLSSSGRAIQQIVKARDEDILKWGILETGDSIFYTSTQYDLSIGASGSMLIKVQDVNGGITTWQPVPRHLGGFYNYLLTRLGNTQLGQVIPCKLYK